MREWKEKKKSTGKVRKSGTKGVMKKEEKKGKIANKKVNEEGKAKEEEEMRNK